MSVRSARRILVYFGVGLLLIEGLARALPAHHWRTPINSFHGVRWLFQEASTRRGPKVVAVGDSALLGGGVHDHDKTLMGRLALAEAGRMDVYNFGVPAGECSTNLLLLDAFAARGVTDIDRAIIEVLPSKFFVGAPSGADAIEALRGFVPFIRPDKYGIPTRPKGFPERTEALLQYELGLASAAYRDRDYLRIEELGGYPAFWAVDRILPPGLRKIVLAQKGRGTNRLGARLEDGSFDPSQRLAGGGSLFTAEPEARYLAQAIDAAKRLTGKAPILLQIPVHYEYEQLDAAATRQTLSALDEADRYLDAVASSTGCRLLRIDSRTFQDPVLWTRTSTHPSTAGQLEMWRRVGPALLRLLE